jgi:hypothetical protein
MEAQQRHERAFRAHERGDGRWRRLEQFVTSLPLFIRAGQLDARALNNVSRAHRLPSPRAVE